MLDIFPCLADTFSMGKGILPAIEDPAFVIAALTTPKLKGEAVISPRAKVKEKHFLSPVFCSQYKRFRIFCQLS
jgi:hypothetical protein